MSESPRQEADESTDSSGKDSSVECPTCGKSCSSRRGMKIHHTREHGESIAGTEVECHWCGDTFRKNPSEARKYDRHFCPGGECHRKWREEYSTGENNPSWDGGKVDVTCSYCGDTISRTPAQLEGREHYYCNTTCMGKHRSEIFTDENHPNWKGGTVECAWCGDELDRDMNQIERSDNFFCGDKGCKAKWQSKNVRGKDHPRWNGGYDNYYGENWEEQRDKRWKMDQYRCVVCGKDERDLRRRPSVHHIIKKERYREKYDAPVWWERANKVENLITLCSKHHKIVEGWNLRPDIK